MDARSLEKATVYLGIAMKEVFKGVFIGHWQDGLDCLSKEQENWFILTLYTEPLCDTATEQQHDKLKHVRCFDEPEADLLSFFDDCVDFIHKGLEKSKVLVHW